MGKKKTGKTKSKQLQDNIPETACRVEIGDETRKAITQAAKEEPIEDILPKTENVETIPAEVKDIEYAENELCMIPCKCLVCGAEWEWGVPLNIGTPMLYFRDCKKCR